MDIARIDDGKGGYPSYTSIYIDRAPTSSYGSVSLSRGLRFASLSIGPVLLVVDYVAIDGMVAALVGAKAEIEAASTSGTAPTGAESEGP